MLFPDLAETVKEDRIQFGEKPIGAGSYGEVWPAHHLILDLPVAVKVVDIRDADREAIERLRRECRILGKIKQNRLPGVVDVQDAFDDELAQRFYIVMEMVDGGNLNHFLLGHKPDLAITVQWAIELCSTLSWLHNQGIIHRDLKPQNILLTSDGQPKICDFGVAHIPLSTLTERQPGTILYMAPELLEGHPATPASDIYSLCAVFFEMWSGRQYFDLRLLSKDDITKEFEDCFKARHPNVGVSILDVLADIVLSGLRKNPAGRTGLIGMQRRLEWLAQQMKTSESFLTRDIPPQIPFERNEQFVGRSEELEQLHTVLQQEQRGGIRPAMLTGLGGVGKTQLAVEYAYRYSSYYPGGIYWINAAQDWLTELADLAIYIDLPAESGTDSEHQKRLARAALDFLNRLPDALVIFDNVEDPLHLKMPIAGFIPTQLACKLLFTTRHRGINLPFNTVEVRVLPEPAAMELLLNKPSRQAVLERWRLDPDSQDADIQAARVICRNLGYLPLALALASAYLGKYPRISFADYLERLRREGSLKTIDASGIDQLDLPTRHDAAVFATLQTQWQAVTNEHARLVAQASALMEEASAIPRARLSLLTGLDEEALPGYPAPLEEALEILHGFWLVEELDDRQVRLHPLVRAFISGTIEDPLAFRKACAERLIEALWQPARLNDEIARRNIYTVLADLHLAKSLGLFMPEPVSEKPINEDLGVTEKFYCLRRVLGLEAHHLSEWQPELQPGFCLQQLRNRALELGLEKLTLMYDAMLSSKGWPYFCQRYRTGGISFAVLRILRGPSGGVSNLLIMPNINHILIATCESDALTWWGWNTRITTWDFETGEEVGSISLLGNHLIETARFYSNGSRLITDRVSPEKECKVVVWDTTTGTLLYELGCHEDRIRSIFVSVDEILAASASKDKTIKIWDLEKRERLHTLVGHEDDVSCVVISSTMQRVISGSADGVLKFWDLQSGEEIYSVKAHDGRISNIMITPNGRQVVSIAADGYLIVWDLDTFLEVRRLGDGINSLVAMDITSDGQFAIVADSSCIHLWDIQSSEEKSTWIAPHGIGSLEIFPDNQKFASIHGGYIMIWDLSIRESAYSGSHESSVSGIAITEDGYQAVSASYDGILKVWDPNRGQILYEIQGDNEYIERVVLNRSGDRAISSNRYGLLQSWDLINGSELYQRTDDPLSKTLLTSDQLRLVWMAGDEVNVLDLETGRNIRKLPVNLPESGFLFDVALTVKDRWLIVLAGDIESDCFFIRIYDFRTGELLKEIEGAERSPELNIHTLQDDYHVLINPPCYPTDIIIWDLHTGLRQDLNLAEEIYYVLGMVPATDLVMSISRLGDLRIQNLFTGKELIRVAGNAGFTACAVTRDGQMMIAGDELGNVYFFDLINCKFTGN